MKKQDLSHVVELLRSTGDLIDQQGQKVWDRLTDWQTAPKLGVSLVHDEPGAEDNGNPRPHTGTEQAARDRLEDVRCARWLAEYRDILTNLEAPLRRLARLHEMALEHDTRPPAEGTWDPILAQEAAHAGYCASCWRLDQQLVEIDTDKHGHRYYRDFCRACGSYKAENGVLPSMDLLRIKQRRQWNTADVTAALTKANKRKSA